MKIKEDKQVIYLCFGLPVLKAVRYLDPDMAGCKYTKQDLENLLWKQLVNLEALSRRVELLEKQNELLVRYNHQLMHKLGDRKMPIPYRSQKKK